VNLFLEMKRRLLLAVMILATAWLIVVGGSSAAYVQALLNPACIPSTIPRPGFQPVTLKSASSLALNGWYHPPSNGALILLLGGQGSTRDSMLAEAAFLAAHGYGALTLDGRQCAGALTTLGYREVEDLQAMVDFASDQPGVWWLGALGFSAGGVTVIRGGARIPQIRAVIAEGNFANLYQEITAVDSPPLSLDWQIRRLVAVAYTLSVGIWPGRVSPLDDLPVIRPRPVLLVHGEGEVKRTRGQAQAEAAGPAGQLWVVPGAGHGQYYSLWPVEYEKKILDFFDAAYLSAQQAAVDR
jgi:hypothetical protein